MGRQWGQHWGYTGAALVNTGPTLRNINPEIPKNTILKDSSTRYQLSSDRLSMHLAYAMLHSLRILQ